MRSVDLVLLIQRRRKRAGLRLNALRRRGARFTLALLAVALLALAGGVLSAAIWVAGVTRDLPSVEQVPALLDPQTGPLAQPTRLYDRSGQTVLLTLENAGIPRRFLSVDPARPDHLSPELVRVVIGLYEPGFWTGSGVAMDGLYDPTPRTLAERLALGLLLNREDPSTRRALRMRLLAAQLVNRYGRTRVLEWYLNSAGFGRLTYGAEAAARLYLDQSAESLRLSDAALLAPLLDTPALNPLDAPAAALERRQSALDTLFGRGLLTVDEYRAASDSPPRLVQSAPQPLSAAPAFTTQALETLYERFGRAAVERGGLTVITTLDLDLQRQMTCVLAAQLKRLDGSTSSAAGCPAAALLPTIDFGGLSASGLTAGGVLLDPATGQLLALSGETGPDGKESALSAHEPGSLLTGFLAVTAFARGYSPASLVWDVPDSLPENLRDFARPLRAYRGPQRLRVALANDMLAPLAGLFDRLGGPAVWRQSSALGLGPLADAGESAQAFFEGARLSPVDLAQAYAVFATQGTLYGTREQPGQPLHPINVRYVLDSSGNVLWNGTAAESQPVLSPALAYLVHSVWSDAQARRLTLGSPNPLEIGRPSGARVASAGDGRTVWAVGYTPQRLGLFWAAREGDSAGGLDPRLAAALWNAVIQYASRDLPADDWPVPAGVSTASVCDPSGLLPTQSCPNIVTEVFLTGNEPVRYDDLYQVVQVNRETGRLATVFTPPELVEERIYLAAPSEARAWADAAGLPVPPETYDAILPPQPSPDAQIGAPGQFAVVRGEVTVRGSAAGSGFASYRVQAGQGLNPQQWLQVGEEGGAPVRDGVLARWDTAGLDGLYALRLLVVRQDRRVETAVVQVTVDNTPPAARLLYPSDGAQVVPGAGRRVTLQADVSDAVGLARVEWWLDGVKIASGSAAPFSSVWDARAGQHRLFVRAVDLAGNQTDTAEITFTVSP